MCTEEAKKQKDPHQATPLEQLLLSRPEEDRAVIQEIQKSLKEGCDVTLKQKGPDKIGVYVSKPKRIV